jgi:hypothetical protein
MNGQGNLTVQGNERHLIFDVQPSEVELIGFTITRGDQAIRVSADATLTLTNSVVKENTSTSAAGGGIFNDGVLTLVGTTVDRNTATEGSGGGIFNSGNGVLTLINSIVSNNVSQSGPGGGIQNDRGIVLVNESEVSENDALAHDGGGISNVNGAVTVMKSIIRGNTTRKYGGGLSNWGFSATMEITDSTVSENKSTGDRHAGGIWNLNGELQTTNTTWSGNHADHDAGAILVEGEDAVATIVNCTVSGNSADGIAGGVRLWNNASVTIINSTIHDNTALDGSAIHIDLASNLELRSSTISNNDDVGRFGIPIEERTSAAIVHFGGGTLTFIQTIIDDTCVAISTTVSMDHNIESPENTCLLDAANDMVNVTPEALNLSDQLADNGGDTLTLMLSRPSVAVDYLISTCDQVEDQRGVPRPQGSECDIGAVEIE